MPGGPHGRPRRLLARHPLRRRDDGGPGRPDLLVAVEAGRVQWGGDPGHRPAPRAHRDRSARAAEVPPDPQPDVLAGRRPAVAAEHRALDCALPGRCHRAGRVRPRERPGQPGPRTLHLRAARTPARGLGALRRPVPPSRVHTADRRPQPAVRGNDLDHGEPGRARGATPARTAGRHDQHPHAGRDRRPADPRRGGGQHLRPGDGRRVRHHHRRHLEPRSGTSTTTTPTGSG